MKIREPQSRVGERINVRRLVDLTAVATKVAISGIVEQDVDDVRPWTRGPLAAAQRGQNES